MNLHSYPLVLVFHDLYIYFLLVDNLGGGVSCRIPTCYQWYGYNNGDHPPGINR